MFAARVPPRRNPLPMKYERGKIGGLGVPLVHHSFTFQHTGSGRAIRYNSPMRAARNTGYRGVFATIPHATLFYLSANKFIFR